VNGPGTVQVRFRAPLRRSARVALAVVAVGLGSLVGSPAQEAAAGKSSVSASPAVVFVGGAADRRQTVAAAVDQYLSVGLLLPDLRIQIHDTKAGCDGFQGYFHPEGKLGVIDLCYPGEFLALHELGHAWDWFNLDDRRRAEFEQLTGLTTWRSTDVAWHDRAAERAANVLAGGLLSIPLETARYHQQVFAEFAALTGITSPRLAEIVTPGTTIPAPDREQLDRLAAYSEWRHAQS